MSTARADKATAPDAGGAETTRAETAQTLEAAETTEEEAARIREAVRHDRRRLAEKVPTAVQEALLVLSSPGIEELEHTGFKCVDEDTRERRRLLVTASRRARDAAATAGFYTLEGAAAVAEEFLMALSNDLWPSEHACELFGTQRPDQDMTLVALLRADLAISDGRGTTDKGDSYARLRDALRDCSGLLVVRGWKILLRTPHGRALLLSDGQMSAKEMDEAVRDSYSAVVHVLATVLVANAVHERFGEWVRAMPVSERSHNAALSRNEKRLLCESLKEGWTEWASSRPKNGW